MNGGDTFYSDDIIDSFYAFDTTGVDICYGSFNLIKNDGSCTVCSVSSCEIQNKGFFFNRSLNHQSTFIKRELFEKYGLYNEENKIISDWEKWIVFLEKGAVFIPFNKVVANFYDGGISSSSSPRYRQEVDLMRQRYFSKEDIEKFKKRNFVKKISLFYVIPLLKIKKKTSEEGVCLKVWLFSFIPFMVVNEISDIKQYRLFGFLPLVKSKIRY